MTEIVLLVVVVIAIPLAIAVVVTLWSLKQVQYKPKRRAPRPSFTTDDSTLEAVAASPGDGSTDVGPLPAAASDRNRDDVAVAR